MKKWIVQFELPCTGLRFVEFLTDNYYEAVGYIECQVLEAQKNIRQQGDEIVDIKRFQYVEGGYAECFYIMTKRPEEEKADIDQIWYLYEYNKEGQE